MYFCETWVCDGTTGHIWGQGGGGGGGGGGGLVVMAMPTTFDNVR